MDTTFESDGTSERPLLPARPHGSAIKQILEQAHLLEREERVLTLRYGWGEDIHQYSRKEVGRILKVTGDRIRQVELSALRKIHNSGLSEQLVRVLDERGELEPLWWLKEIPDLFGDAVEKVSGAYDIDYFLDEKVPEDARVMSAEDFLDDVIKEVSADEARFREPPAQPESTMDAWATLIGTLRQALEETRAIVNPQAMLNKAQQEFVLRFISDVVHDVEGRPKDEAFGRRMTVQERGILVAAINSFSATEESSP